MPQHNKERIGRLGMNKTDISRHFGRSTSWVNYAVRSGLIPPPISTNFWLLPVIEAWLDC